MFSVYILCALMLDALFGDPRWYPHPVKGIGAICSWFEKVFYDRVTNRLFGGLLAVLFTVGISTVTVVLLLLLFASIHPFVESISAILILYTAVAMKDLLVHSNNVYDSLCNKSIENSRKEIGKIVGRDTDNLTEEQISKACVETVAENMVDGVTAPLLYAFFIGLFIPIFSLSPIACGAVGAIFYKAVNTMDSMVGYKNSRYSDYGTAAAKLDDFVNFIPARISGFVLIIAAFILKFDYKNSAKIFIRDRLKHASPNAGHPEAAVAGALGVQVGGPSVYFGNSIDKPFIGEKTRDLDKKDIMATNKLVIVGSIIFYLFCFLVAACKI